MVSSVFNTRVLGREFQVPDLPEIFAHTESVGRADLRTLSAAGNGIDTPPGCAIVVVDAMFRY